MTSIDFATLIPKFDAILERGLCMGLGHRDGQMCIEAAICAALELPHGDNPLCVESSVRAFKIELNDAQWWSPQTRAAGLRALGVAQIGSAGIVDGTQFTARLAEKTVRVLLPQLFRQIFPNNTTCLAAAERCEKEGTRDAARAATIAAYAVATAVTVATAATAATHAAYAAATAATAAYVAFTDATDAAYAATTAAYAATAVTNATGAAYASVSDKYLLLGAELALKVLRELNSPGCAYVTEAA